MTICEKFKEEFDERYILSKCRENKCSLKDITQKDYLILNGDMLKESDREKSVDCIIIDLNKNTNGKYRIILCELTAGHKTLSDLQEKFKSSGKLIVKTMNEFNEDIYKIDCLLLGKLNQNGKSIGKKALSSPIRIDRYIKPTPIRLESCGFSIKKLNLT